MQDEEDAGPLLLAGAVLPEFRRKRGCGCFTMPLLIAVVVLVIYLVQSCR